MKKFWSIIKTLTPSEHVSSVPMVLEDEKTGNKINRPDLIAEKFIHYFCRIGKKLAAKFDLAPSNDYQIFLTKRFFNKLVSVAHYCLLLTPSMILLSSIDFAMD